MLHFSTETKTDPVSLTLSDPLQLFDQRQLLPLREVCLLSPLTSKLPGPLHNTARSVPSGPVDGASTNTLSGGNMVLSFFAAPLQMSSCNFEICVWVFFKLSMKNNMKTDERAELKRELMLGQTGWFVDC